MSTRTEPGLLDALALLAQATDEVLVDTARDTHLAVVDRIHRLLDRQLGSTSVVTGRSHRLIAGSVYAGVGVSLSAVTAGLDLAARSGAGPLLETSPRSEFVRSAVNGLIGDRIERERPRLAITMAPRAAGRDVPLTSEGLASTYADASGRVVVFLHGLCENENYWRRGASRRGTTYATELAARGWTPVMLRANTGLAVRSNGVTLAALLEKLVEQWPTDVTRLALVGHSMGDSSSGPRRRCRGSGPGATGSVTSSRSARPTWGLRSPAASSAAAAGSVGSRRWRVSAGSWTSGPRESTT
ncbi:esterase/lipase family protein [Nocardioides piscis]|uniref:Alpha/beta hydrolase n=1 Tax=Nocardioides piscis TaxID=2714938 RepID=A0A6G7YK57_9ACTN|nr:alpha/beta hydrolase [Nocardioides piscis]QIK77106.1 alpha/beta hydrolase [Nocardioides piscis]